MKRATQVASCRVGFLRVPGITVLLLSLMVSPLFAKRNDDRVVLKNGDRVTGEIKRIQHGKVFFKPGYALHEIEMDWTQVEQLDSLDRFNVLLTNGTVHSGLIRKVAASNEFTISLPQTIVRVSRSEVIRVLPVEDSRWRQITGSVDYGFTYASGNSEIQSSLGADAAYFGEKHSFASSLTSSLSRQTTGINTTRNSLTADYSRHLSDKWSATVLGSVLSSTQQELDLRTSLGGGLARTLIRTSNTRSVFGGGVVVSREKYTSDAGLRPHATAAEAWLGLEFSHFRFKVFDLNSRLLVYPSLSTAGRVRLGSESTISWEFVKSLTSNLRIYENYDSHPPINAPKNDFGVTTSIGYKF